MAQRPSASELNNFATEKYFENINKGVGRVAIDSASPNVKLVKDGVDLVEYYNTYIEPRAEIFKPMSVRAGICPFHKDTDPSFHANNSKQYYHCFGCGYTGSIIAVHRQIRFNYDKITLTEEEALQELANIYKIKLLELEQDEASTDIFATAKTMLLDTEFHKKYTGDITLTSYAQNNRRIANMPIPLERKLKFLAELDLQMAAYLTSD